MERIIYLLVFFFYFTSATILAKEDTYGLIIGGQCSHAGNLCDYVEKISPDSVCIVDIPPPPINSQEAEAVFYRSAK